MMIDFGELLEYLRDEERREAGRDEQEADS